MREIRGNIWDYLGEAVIVITTNGTVKKNGEAVMGRGCALEAKQRFPRLPLFLGDRLTLRGNHVHYFSRCLGLPDLVTFPVKHNWWEKADLALIERSCKELLKLAYDFNWEKIIVPRPGCGNGGLDWRDVKPVLERYFDDRFLVISKKGVK